MTILFFDFDDNLSLGVNKIKMVDAVGWNWNRAGRGLGYGLALGLFAGLVRLVENGLSFGLTVGLGTGLSMGLFFVMVLGLIGGVKARPIGEATYPGQRITISIRNYFFILLLGGLAALLAGLIVGVITDPFRGLIVGLFIWLFLVFAGLGYGGLAVIQHYVLRIIIGFNKFLPWRLIPFLDYCVERIFLRPVSGGYIFVHRLLMEHFAAMYLVEEEK